MRYLELLLNPEQSRFFFTNRVTTVLYCQELQSNRLVQRTTRKNEDKGREANEYDETKTKDETRCKSKQIPDIFQTSSYFLVALVFGIL